MQALRNPHCWASVFELQGGGCNRRIVAQEMQFVEASRVVRAKLSCVEQNGVRLVCRHQSRANTELKLGQYPRDSLVDEWRRSLWTLASHCRFNPHISHPTERTNSYKFCRPSVVTELCERVAPGRCSEWVVFAKWSWFTCAGIDPLAWGRKPVARGPRS